MLFKVKGILNFTPEDVTRKHKNQSSWKRVALIKTDCDIADYYAWFLKTRFNLKLNPPLRGTHVTFISDRLERSVFEQASQIFNGKEITFYYDPSNIRSNGVHWWINVECEDALSIRESIGLSREPYFGLHLTIGTANPKNIDHSKYILE